MLQRCVRLITASQSVTLKDVHCAAAQTRPTWPFREAMEGPGGSRIPGGSQEQFCIVTFLIDAMLEAFVALSTLPPPQMKSFPHGT